jgi:transcriptional regulator with XRE-family HTH domain
MNDERLQGLALGARIAALRERRGLERGALAQRADLEPEALADYEAGRSTPSVGELVRLAGVRARRSAGWSTPPARRRTASTTATSRSRSSSATS